MGHPCASHGGKLPDACSNPKGQSVLHRNGGNSRKVGVHAIITLWRMNKAGVIGSTAKVSMVNLARPGRVGLCTGYSHERLCGTPLRKQFFLSARSVACRRKIGRAS